MTRKILLGILVVLLLVGGTGASLYHRAGTSIDTHRREIAALLDDLPLRHATRPALTTPEEPGNIWDLLGPAFESLRNLLELRTDPAYISTRMDANFNLNGTAGATPQLLEEGRAALDACRRSMRRSTLDWSGPMNPDLPFMAARAGRALSSMGLQSWQEGRDVEALDWMLTALSVAYDAARLGQHHTGKVLRVIEDWVVEDAHYLLSEQALTAAQVSEVERRLDQLRAQRPPLALEIQVRGAEARLDFLEEVEQPDSRYDHTDGPGWKDLYSRRIYIARMLTGLRSACDDAGRMTWTAATDPVEQWNSLSLPLREEVAGRLGIGPSVEIAALIQLEGFRCALACARFQAAEGRLPRTIEETGYAPALGARRVTIEEDRVVVPGGGTAEDPTTQWKIGRR